MNEGDLHMLYSEIETMKKSIQLTEQSLIMQKLTCSQHQKRYDDATAQRKLPGKGCEKCDYNGRRNMHNFISGGDMVVCRSCLAEYPYLIHKCTGCKKVTDHVNFKGTYQCLTCKNF